ncbi:hypothetical protein hamaS1_07390 [Moorella sp. Hama-1]|uniref:oligosaccharide repeat unit polymerase n=1 Tax=Moorella sp. Hama-1 TaxID=2138101 RepID=UPI000D655325|nr:oligosaccharide repeat unit polymerase [Moorella sp. Hama-1]BCV20670.1 hypothetical protein hamaS1_07390 [Moorella sp. Hama-1]
MPQNCRTPVPLSLESLGQLDYFVVDEIFVDNEVLKYHGLILTNLTILFVIFGYLWGKKRFFTRVTDDLQRVRDLDAHSLGIIVVLANVMATIGLMGLLMIPPSTNDRLAYTAGSVLSRLTIFRYLSYGVVLAVYYYISRNIRTVYTLLNALAFLGVYLLKLGDRAPALALGLSVFFALTTSQKKARFKLVIIICLLLYVGIAWQYVRWHWDLGEGFKNLAFVIIESLIYGLPFSLSYGELSYLYKAEQALLFIVPKYFDYLYGASYLRLLMFFIPSSVFGGFKPRETQLIIAEMFGVGITGASRPATFIGDAYLNLGWFGPVAGILLGYVIACIQRFFTSKNGVGLAVASLGPYGVIVWLRGSLNGITVCAVWLFLIWVMDTLLKIGGRHGGKSAYTMAE